MIKKCFSQSLNNDGRVAFNEKQCLTPKQKEQARKNIGLDNVPTQDDIRVIKNRLDNDETMIDDITTQLQDVVHEAPNDGKIYGRKNETWEVVTSKKGEIIYNFDNLLPNKTYIINENIDLNESKITIPENDTFIIEGGVISNGELVGNNTIIQYDGAFVDDDLKISGSWNVPIIFSRMLVNPTKVNNLRTLFNFTNANVNNEVYLEDHGEPFLMMPWLNESDSRAKDVSWDYIKTNSNTNIYVTGEIKVLANKYPRWVIFAVIGDNVNINGGTYTGDIDEHDFSSISSTHEWCIAIDVRSSTVSSITGYNTQIENTKIYGFPGDGIQVLGENCLIQNTVIEHCGRQGISVLRGENVTIDNFIIRDIFHTTPSFAIDVESESGRCRNIAIRNGLIEQHIKEEYANRLQNGISIGSNSKHNNNIVENVIMTGVNSGLQLVKSNYGTYRNIDITAVSGNTSVDAITCGGDYNTFENVIAKGYRLLVITDYKYNTFRNCKFELAGSGMVFIRQPENYFYDCIFNETELGRNIFNNSYGNYYNCEFNLRYQMALTNKLYFNNCRFNFLEDSQGYTTDNYAFEIRLSQSEKYDNCVFNIEEPRLTKFFDIRPTSSQDVDFYMINCKFISSHTTNKLFGIYSGNPSSTAIDTYYKIDNICYNKAKCVSLQFTDSGSKKCHYILDGELLDEKRTIKQYDTIPEDVTDIKYNTKNLIIEKDLDLSTNTLTLSGNIDVRKQLTNGTVKLASNTIVSPGFEVLKNVTIVGNPIETQKAYFEHVHKYGYYNGTKWVDYCGNDIPVKYTAVANYDLATYTSTHDYQEATQFTIENTLNPGLYDLTTTNVILTDSENRKYWGRQGNKNTISVSNTADFSYRNKKGLIQYSMTFATNSNDTLGRQYLVVSYMTPRTNLSTASDDTGTYRSIVIGDVGLTKGFSFKFRGSITPFVTTLRSTYIYDGIRKTIMFEIGDDEELKLANVTGVPNPNSSYAIVHSDDTSETNMDRGGSGSGTNFRNINTNVTFDGFKNFIPNNIGLYVPSYF